MDIDDVMEDALRSESGALAIACADVQAGFVLGASARGEADAGVGERESDGPQAVSTQWVHAYARVATRPELVVVGVANGDANVGLLLDGVEKVAGGLRAEELEARSTGL